MLLMILSFLLLTACTKNDGDYIHNIKIQQIPEDKDLLSFNVTNPSNNFLNCKISIFTKNATFIKEINVTPKSSQRLEQVIKFPTGKSAVTFDENCFEY